MRAAYLVAPGRIEIRDDPDPIAPPGGVVVRIRVALTDGTDAKAFRRGHPQMPMPTRFGHEFSGDVIAVGSGVTNFAAGDSVATVHSAPDRTCFWCRRDREELCESVMATKILGAYADAIVVPKHIVAQNMFRKPESMSYEVAAFLEPLACVVHAQSDLGMRRGDTVVVIGDGGFGLLHAQLAASSGARAILVGRRAARLALARTLGVVETVDAHVATSLGDEIRARTDGRGADVAIECSGSAEVWESTPDLVRRGGTVVLFGGLPSGTQVRFDAARLHYDEVLVRSPFHFTPRAVRAAFDILCAGAIDVAPLISRRYPLERLAAAFEDLGRRDGLNVKFAITP